jgi:hypothetical protein
MGKTSRIVCIFTPMVLTIASVIALTIVQASGSRRGLSENYSIRIDFSGFSATEPGSLSDWNGLGDTLHQNHDSGRLNLIYQIYLWNYCTASETSSEVGWCSKRRSKFVFDPVRELGLNVTMPDEEASTEIYEISSPTSFTEYSKERTKLFGEDLLSDAAPGTLRVYKTVAEWNFIAYQMAYATSILTVLIGSLATCSRWGSLCTWIVSIVCLFRSILANAWDGRS